MTREADLPPQRDNVVLHLEVVLRDHPLSAVHCIYGAVTILASAVCVLLQGLLGGILGHPHLMGLFTVALFLTYFLT